MKMLWLRTVLLTAAAIMAASAAVYRPHKALYPMINTTLRWKLTAKRLGPNMCAKETIWENLPKTFDVAWTGGSYCVPTTIQLECCEGWTAVSGQSGCPRATAIKSAEEASSGVRASWWLRLLSMAGLKTYLADAPDTLTIFAPVVVAARSLSNHSQSLLNQGAKQANRLVDAPQMLLTHIVRGRMHTETLHNDQILSTMSSHLNIRVNVYPNGLITANCVPILSRDVLSDGPIIHTLTNILPQYYQYLSADLILREPPLRRFAVLINQSGLDSRLRHTGPFTVLAPTDAALETLGSYYEQALRYDRIGLQALVLNHLMEGVHCSVMLSNARLKTQQTEYIKTRCSADSTYVEDAKIVKGDMMAANGVVHMVDRVLMPPRAMLMKDLLLRLGLTDMYRLISLAGLDAMFLSPTPFTLFAPDNTALEDPHRRYNATEARNFIMSHIAPGRIQSVAFKNMKQFDSYGHRSPFTLRITREKVLIDAAKVVSSNAEGLNGVVHVINRPLVPPSRKSIIQWLTEENVYNEFLYALRTIQPGLYVKLERTNEKFTVFAVRDYHLTNRLFFYYDPRALKNHVVSTAVVSEEVAEGGELQLATADDRLVSLRRRADQLLYGTTLVVQRDILCANGVIHVVEDVVTQY